MRGDRVLGAREDRDRVRPADGPLLGEVEDHLRVFLVDDVQVGAPHLADPDVARAHRLAGVRGVLADQRLLLLEQRQGLVELPEVAGVRVVAELDEREREALLPLVEHRDVLVEARVPECLAAGQRVGDLAGVVGDARRPPHVRHRVLVARVVARIRPLLAQVDQVRDQREVELHEGALGDEVRDVDRDRERDVVAAAVVAELRVGLIGVREEVVGDLDAVLLLEGGDRVLADVLGPVVDEQLRLGLGHRRRRDRGRRARGARWLRPRLPPTQMPMRPRTGSRRPRSTPRSPVPGRPPVRTSRSPRAAAGG